MIYVTYIVTQHKIYLFGQKKWNTTKIKNDTRGVYEDESIIIAHYLLKSLHAYTRVTYWSDLITTSHIRAAHLPPASAYTLCMLRAKCLQALPYPVYSLKSDY